MPALYRKLAYTIQDGLFWISVQGMPWVFGFRSLLKSRENIVRNGSARWSGLRRFCPLFGGFRPQLCLQVRILQQFIDAD